MSVSLAGAVGGGQDAASGDDTPVAPWRAANKARFDQLQFRFRLAIVVTLSIGCVLVPSVGERRFVVAVFLATVVLPSHFLIRRVAGVPNPTGWLDLLAVVSASIVALFEPSAWPPALLFQMLSIGGAIAYLTPVWVYRLIAASVPAMALAAAIHRIPGSVPMLVVVLAFLPPLLVGSTIKRAREMQAADRLHAAVGSLPVVVWEADATTGAITSMTGRADGLFGRSRNEIVERGLVADIVADDRPAMLRRFGPAGREKGDRSIEYRYRRPDGSLAYLRDRVAHIETASGPVVRGVTLDVTDAQAQEIALERHAQIVEHMGATTITLLPDGDGVRRLGHVVDAIDWGIEARIDQPLQVALPEFAAWPEFRRAIDEAASVRLPARRFADRLGHERWVEIEVFPLPGDAVAVVIADVTAREVAAELVRHQATHDDLTGLANRTILLEHIDESIARLGSVALLLVDLNEFKEVNDTLGHLSGDEYLRALGRRLDQLSGPSRFVARLGGDEFAVVLHEPNEVAIDGTVDAIAQACSEPVYLFDSAVASGASIGIACAPQDAGDAEALLRRADLAMYEAKRRRTVAWHFERRLERDVGQVKLLGQLADAFERDQFEMHFQPIVRLADDEFAGAEALVRWNHPDLGVLAPDRFLDLLTVAGRSADLARVAVSQSAEVLRSLPDDLTISVNLTSQNIRNPRLPALLSRTLRLNGLTPDRFVLEITEQHVLDPSGVVRATVEELASAGFSVAIDDFGTGYASLVHLRSLPIAQVKLDRQFVTSMTRNRDDLAIVRSMIALGHDLGLCVVAEGVESESTAEALRELGCDRAQGFLWAPPEPFAASRLAGRATDEAARPAVRRRPTAADRREDPAAAPR